jgi:hypothetical protein
MMDDFAAFHDLLVRPQTDLARIRRQRHDRQNVERRARAVRLLTWFEENCPDTLERVEAMIAKPR